MATTSIPWIEKYRPTNFDSIVLDSINRTLFENILKKKHFPNLLFYGPPGTGKTTTIINLINEYQKKNSGGGKGSVIHLNASDERGIDIIRNQINQFVRSMSLFETGFKFVILDEVDYMTKNAQQALKYLLQTSTYNVRFCLICNYISKIDESLQNEFICVRFNQLPKKDIYHFIKSITEKENIEITDENIDTIQTIYHSDIRSMINFLQLNQNIENLGKNIIHRGVWEQIHALLSSSTDDHVEPDIFGFIHDISIKYNMDKKNIIQTYLNYVIRNYPQLVSGVFLNIVEKIIQNQEIKNEHVIYYFIFSLRSYYASM
jgi:DNA polymerase III delta prime subunit